MQELILHPSASDSRIAQLKVSASAEVSNSQITFTYEIKSSGRAPRLLWQSNSLGTSDQRKDELWKKTCLEAFLLNEDGSYFEMNFSPQGEWNVYRFESYRQGMQTENRITELSAFSAAMQSNAQLATYNLSATVDLSQILKSSQHFRLGLTAVIETEGGERSYWSLKHPGEKPDFHDSRGQILEMRISRDA